MAATPKLLKNMNVVFDGIGYAGIATEVTLPTLTIQTEDYRAGGMDMAVPVDLGMEPMEMGVTFSEFKPEVLKQFGLVDQNSVAITFTASLVDNNDVSGMEIKVRGMIKDMPLGTINVDQINTLEVTLGLRYYKMTIDGEVIHEIDADNMIRTIGGVDQLARQRAALNI